ncbi:SGNH/GDSL hydrolase family protein [Endozoicomonas sp. OPT23]|uniref:SGNH/GDSL hydrolase family protein n=1 Tax=Endozoicomonas sp. OPT23 TaxID=2072845 RepID=UPI0018918A78|nr:SGNH/GDSL hydrolase family protein [Endozoicomonas sp. OPT23]
MTRTIRKHESVHVFVSFITILIFSIFTTPLYANTTSDRERTDRQCWHENKQQVLVFGDSNTWGWKPVAEGFPARRYAKYERWTSILESTLNNQHPASVIADGLISRTINLDAGQAVGELTKEAFNGSRDIVNSMAKHAPLDWIVIMLGTNDLAPSYERSPKEIAEAAFALAEKARQQDNILYSAYRAPQVLLIVPPPIGSTVNTPLHGIFDGAQTPSKQIAAAFLKEADKHTDIHLLDAGQIITTDGIDGVHFSRQNHITLGKAVARFLLRKDSSCNQA